MNTIKLIFPFRAISKDNEKMFNRHGRPFLSKKYKDFDALVKQQARIQYRGEILECPLIVSIIYRFKNTVR